MAGRLFNLAKMNTSTTGTGTITLTTASSGFLTFAQAGVTNGLSVTYIIEDGANRELGVGTYTSSGTTLTRSVIKSTNADSAINLSGSATVGITAAAENFTEWNGTVDANGFSIGFDDNTGITDDSGNEVLRFRKSSSAVNYFEVLNTETGVGPELRARGDDTNIPVRISGKGTGAVVLNGVTLSSFGLSVVDDSTASDARQTLGVKAPVSQEFTGDGTYTRTLSPIPAISVDIIAVGGGGGSTGCAGLASNAAGGNHGGSGGEVIRRIVFATCAVTAATNASQCVVTMTDAWFEAGDVINISGTAGMTGLNANHTVVSRSGNNVTIDFNSTSAGTYTSGGSADFRSTPVTVGDGGTAGISGDTSTGGNGGDTTFGAHLTAGGGFGGPDTGILTPGTAPAPGGAGAGGTATGGDVNIPGETGRRSVRVSGTVLVSGAGGSTRWGFGPHIGINTAGQPGTGYGSGACGASSLDGADRAGAVGAPGVLWLTENFF